MWKISVIMLVKVLVTMVYLMAVTTDTLGGKGSSNECPMWFEHREMESISQCLRNPSIEGYIYSMLPD